jgi:PLP dependent protein
MIYNTLDHIRHRISLACERARRDPASVSLLAVTKTFPVDRILEAVHGGVTDVGENYVQELLPKKELLAAHNIRWHFIGHLQSNKAKYIAGWIHLIHSLDSLSLARELDKCAAREGRLINVLIEVNTTGENSKFGVPPTKTLDFVQSLAPFEHIRIVGLMTIGPFLPDPEESRPMFRQLRRLSDSLADTTQANMALQHLSMNDWRL